MVLLVVLKMLVNKFLFRCGISSNVRLLVTTSGPLNRAAETNASNSETYYKQQGLKQEGDDGKPADWDSGLPFEAIPGPKPLPYIGNAHQFIFGKYGGMDFLELDHALYKDFGNISVLRALPGRKPIVLLYDPVDIEKMFRNEGIWPHREIMPSLQEYRTKTRKEFFDTAPGIITVHGEEWFNMRTKVNPILMQPRTIKNYTDGMDAVTTDAIKIIKKLSKENSNNIMPKNFEDYMQNWALEGVGYVGLSRRFGCLRDDPSEEALKLIDSINRTFRNFFQLDFLPVGFLFKKFNTNIWKTFVKDMDFLTDTVKKYIDEAIIEIENRKVAPADVEQSVLEKLLAIDKKVAVTMVIDMIMAGVETSTKSTAIALYYIAKNKEAQKKLREELVTIMPTPDSPLTKEGLDNASYLKAAIKESMRLSPVAVASMRTSTKEIVLGGYQIPRGVDVLGANAVISRSSEHYDRPNEFIPERWLRSTKDELSHKNTSPFVTLPFGFGPRSCVGQRLALLALQVYIGKVVRNFEVDWPHKDMKFATLIVHACADPLEFKMTPVTR